MRRLPQILSVILMFAATSSLLAQSGSRLVVMQDERPPLPEDNTVKIASSFDEVEIRLASLVNKTEEFDLLAEVNVITPDLEKRKVTPDRDSKLKIDGLAEGLHMVLAESTDAIACIPFYVDRLADQLVDDIAAADRQITVPMIDEGAKISRAALAVYGGRGGDSNSVLAQPRLEYDTAKRHDYMVRVTADGRLLGKVITQSPNSSTLSLAGNNSLFLLQGGKRIREARSDQSGAFEFKDVTPGVYGVVASGPAGYTAFAFEAGDASLAMQTNSDGHRFVALAGDSVLPVVLVPQTLLEPAAKQIRRSPCAGRNLLTSEPKKIAIPVRQLGGF